MADLASSNTEFDEGSHKGGVSAMKKQLSTLGKSITEAGPKAQWKEMTTGFCSLFDRYLKTKYDTVKWFVHTLAVLTLKGQTSNLLRLNLSSLTMILRVRTIV